MTKSRGRFQISLKSFMLLPLLVLLGLILISWHFKYSVASGTPGFDVSLAGLSGGSDAHDQFESWLQTNGYEHCQRPKLGSHNAEHRESWYFGKHDEVEHYILVSSSDSVLRAEVHFEAEIRIFEGAQTDDSETSATDAVAHKLRSWWEQNSSILKTRKQHD